MAAVPLPRPAVKTGAKPKPIKPLAPREAMQAAILRLEVAAKSGHFTQDDLRIYADTVQAVKVAAKAIKAAEEALVSVRGQINESVEAGPIVVQFTDAERRTPAWKDEAITQAKRVAEFEAVPFNETLYVEGVRNATPPSMSTSVSVIVPAV